jgi:hypothetical protein
LAQETTMNTLASLSAVAMAFALTAGAASAQEADRKAAAKSAARQESARVLVTNNGWMDARIYLDDDGLLVPIGFVMAQQSVELPLPARALIAAGGLRIVADPIGSRGGYVSDNLLIGKGDAVLVTLQNQLSLSSTSVLPAS